MMSLEERICKLKDLICASTNTIVFTGAGCSTESGIKDFRSPGGVWSKYRMITFQEFVKNEDDRKEQWLLHRDLWREFSHCEPNPAHHSITKLHRKKLIDAVITQNIDSLHQRSGMDEEAVIELHGNERSVYCLSCGERCARQEIQRELESGVEIPLCTKCGGILKTATIWFGEALPQKELERAFFKAENCELCIVVGSSLSVYPAAMVPEVAMKAGSKLVIINRDSTHLDSYANLVFSEPAGEILQKAAEGI